MAYTIEKQNIYAPERIGGDGISLAKEAFYIVDKCFVDFNSLPLEDMDECIGITRGAQAYIQNSVFTGAQKIALVGCGDKEWFDKEQDKIVVFNKCNFMYGARRMPEVQDGMKVLLLNCTIEGWCNPDRYQFNPKKNRGFGAWAHNGGEILAINCHFIQHNYWTNLKLMLYDFLGHFGQTFNDEGILGFFKPKNWIPGVCRGLTSGLNGKVQAYNCTKNHWWIRIENNKSATSKLSDILDNWLKDSPIKQQIKNCLHI